MRAIASLLLLGVFGACGAEDPEPSPTSPPLAPAPPPWLGDWPLAYGLDLSLAIELPDAAPEAHPFRRHWPQELSWLRPVAEPILEAWLQGQMSPALTDFFVEAEALPARVEDVELHTRLTLSPDGQLSEQWQALSLPEACGGEGLEVPLKELRTSEGGWWQEEGQLRLVRRLRFRSEAASRALLEGLARCVGAPDLATLFEEGLDCELSALGPELSGLGGVLCEGLRESWREKYRPRGEVHEWEMHQGLEPGPLKGGGEEVLVTADEATPRPRITSWRVR
ncbi:MAG: hypothetical protein AAGD10_19495 [Myxococcota bacterium]